MAVKRVDPAGWYGFTYSGNIVCGSCLLDDLDKTAKGDLKGEEAVTLDMVYELSLDEGAYQCDNCLEQSENYDDEIDNFS